MAGMLLAALGTFALASPWRAYIKLIHYSGIVLLLNGGLLMVISFTSSSSPRERQWLLIESLMDIFFGIILLFNPLFSFIAFSFFIGSWMVGKGTLKMIASMTLARLIVGWIYAFMAGILSIVFGLLVIYNPLGRSDGITLFIGAFGWVMGLLYIFDSLRFRKMEDSLDMMF